MSQVTLYLPEALLRDVRRLAKAKRLSVSAYVTELVRREATVETWPEEFLATFGSWEGDELQRLPAPPHERRPKLR